MDDSEYLTREVLIDGNERQADTWRQYAWVARRFELSRRLDNVDWSTHHVLASIEDEDKRYEFLQKATEANWTVRQARSGRTAAGER